MMDRRSAILLSIAALLASPALVRAAALPDTRLSLAPRTITADEEDTDTGLLMMGMDKAGLAKPMTDNQLKIYGWIEGGYTYSHRHHSAQDLILPGPYNHEFGNHFMLNQLVLRFEKQVASDKFDVGGMVEVMYGSDAGQLHAGGLGYNGSDPTDDNNPNDPLAVANLHPILQFDVVQAYVDVNVPVGSGLKVRIGKFISPLGYEAIDPTENAFYSHSYLFSATPNTHTGVLGSYNLNDQWSVMLGVTRGWDAALEDNNGSPDVLGQFSYKPSKTLAFLLNYSIGPEDNHDNSHYRVAINPQATWQVTDKFSMALDSMYVYDGGLNGDASAGTSHAYGDIWGAAVYASYVLNDYVTLNGRAEKYHSDAASFGALGGVSSGITTLAFAGGTSVPTLNVYSLTLGVTVTPLPKDPIGKNLTIRPEIRYDWSEDHVFAAGTRAFQDQLTFAADVIFKF